MPISVVTIQDLQEFKEELLQELKDLFKRSAEGSMKKYVKSSEVIELLKISSGTLQNLRVNGTLPYSKVGGIIYYNYEDIQKLMDANKIDHSRDL